MSSENIWPVMMLVNGELVSAKDTWLSSTGSSDLTHAYFKKKKKKLESKRPRDQAILMVTMDEKNKSYP